MKRKKEPNDTYHFPFLVTLIGWLLEMFIFGSLGFTQQISARILVSSLLLLTACWWLSMLAHSLLFYFSRKNKKR